MTQRFATVALLWAALAACLDPLPAKLRAAGPPEVGVVTRCTPVYVVDGDTVDVEITRRVRVRLLDAWCPELDTQEGKSAKRFVESMVIGKSAVLFIPAPDKQLGDAFTFNRALGHLWIGGDRKSVNQTLVEMKYATRTKGDK
jgi:endonuclease YncB( thermonuclease family)